MVHAASLTTSTYDYIVADKAAAARCRARGPAIGVVGRYAGGMPAHGLGKPAEGPDYRLADGGHSGWLSWDWPV